MTIRIILTLFWLPLLVACTGEEPTPGERESDSPPGLRFEMVEQTFEHPDCKTSDQQACVTLQFHYPEFQADGQLEDSLRNWTMSQLSGYGSPVIKPEKLAREWFGDYDQFAREIEQYDLPWSLERRVELIYMSNNLVTLHFNEFSYTGGAHPMQLDHFRSFSRPDGATLILEDLTYDNRNFHALAEMAEEQFRFTYELFESEDLFDAGFHFLDGEFHLTDNFAFTEYGLLFYFNAYEVVPYATDPIAIEIPYEDLEHLIRPAWLKDRPQFTL